MRLRFWLQWVFANAVAELLGLGIVATVGYLVVRAFGEPSTPPAALAVAALFVGLGAVEGCIVGLAQHVVLRVALPQVSGWVRATVLGAVVSWLLGMMPSTIMSILFQEPGAPPPEVRESVRLLAAAALGLLAGPVLAFFQWRRLRLGAPARAWLWLPANAAAWSLGMPVVFFAAHMAAQQSGVQLIASTVGISLFVAGSVVGAVHGAFLIYAILPHEPPTVA